jgi:CRP-like cAMP-binding protein
MDALSYFFTYLNKFAPVSQKEYEDHLVPIIQVRKFQKKEIVSYAGEVEDDFNFIIKGLARKYYKKGEEEINTQISAEGHLILSQESFHSRTPSEYFIETIEPTTFITIKYDALEKMYRSSWHMERLGRLIITFSMIIKDRWQMQMVKMTPRERFLHFVERNPDLIQRVPQKYLASYLNIKPETFSRFKHLTKPQPAPKKNDNK